MNQYTILPPKLPDLWEFYEQAESALWKVQEVSLSDDRFDDLDEDVKYGLKKVLSTFAASDIIVNANIVTSLLPYTEEKEAQFYYGIQVYVEQVHSVMYGQFIINYIKSPEERDILLNGIEEIPAVKEKAKWALKWLNKEASFEQKLVAFSLLEGIGFSSQFSFIFYIRSLGLMPGLCLGNNFIATEEAHHFKFANYYYLNYCENKLDKQEILEMVIDCVNTEINFVEEIIPKGLKGLTKEQMIQYVKYVGDTVLMAYQIEPFYKVSQPLSFMESITLPRKANFFEKKTNEYTILKLNEELDFNTDFDY